MEPPNGASLNANPSLGRKVNDMNRLLMFVLALTTIACGNSSPEAQSQTATQPATVSEPAPAPADVKTPEQTQREQDAERRAKWQAEQKAEAAKGVVEYEVPEGLNELYTDPNATLTFHETVAKALMKFVDVPKTYDETEDLKHYSLREYSDIPEVQRRARDKTRSIMAVYGIVNNEVVPSELEKPLQAIFTNSTSREVAYKLATPSIKRALVSLPERDRNDYVGILRHASAYLGSFNLAAETMYLASLAGDCKSNEWQQKYYPLPEWWKNANEGSGEYFNCAYLFTNHGPNGKRNPYRKVEAFLYRRAMNGWDVTAMKFMLDRLIADLS